MPTDDDTQPATPSSKQLRAAALSVTARAATQGLWFDCSERLTRDKALALGAHGFVGCMRYVPLPGNNPANDIDLAELSMLIQVGFDVLLVQHVRYPGWSPWLHSGGSDADAAIARAANAGYPQGAHLFLDLEGVDTTCTAERARVYVDSWGARVIRAGYRCGLYVGYQIPLDADDLYYLHTPDAYWSDAGNRRVTTRGCSIQQGKEVDVDGVRIDYDTVSPDLLGEVPICAASVVVDAAA